MKKKYIFILIVMLTIGFAAVSTTLIINGVVGIGTNEDNYIDGVVFDEDSLSSSEGTTAEISESGRTITFTTQEMTSVGEEARVNFKIKNYSQYNAVLGTPAISCYFMDNHEVDAKAEEKSTTNEYMEIIPGHELDGKIINAGGGLSNESSVMVKQIKSYVGNPQTIKFQCEINTSSTDSDTPSIEKPIKMPEGYYLTNDLNDNGIADIGDEIRVGTESFYVISHNAIELNALAKYNLNVGDNKNPNVTEGIQHETVRGYLSSGIKYGNVKFSNNNGWPYENNDTITIKKYDGPVKDALYGEDGKSGYQSYIWQTIPNATVRLIEKAELETLGCSSTNYTCSGSDYTWLYSASYWTQSASSDSSDSVWMTSNARSFIVSIFNYEIGFGVRPVITISLS